MGEEKSNDAIAAGHAIPSTEQIQIGNADPSTEYMKSLQEAWRRHDIVLFVGAGFSAPYQIPTWRDLVMQLLLEAEPQFDGFWPEYRTALADWMTTEYSFDLLALSRVIKCILGCNLNDSSADVRQIFAETVRKKLYAQWSAGRSSKSHNDAIDKAPLRRLATLIKSAEAEGAGPTAIVSMNFDDLLEQELEEAHVVHHTVSEQHAARGTGLPIIHPHGFLPHEGPIANVDLVFSEDEYHQLSHTPFHWAVTEMLTYLRRNSVLFLGLSMADQTLRRLLDATVPRNSGGQPSDPFRRFVLRRDYSPPQDLNAAANKIETQAKEMRSKTRNNKRIKGPAGIAEAINVMVKQGHDFDCRLFGDMGVGIVWYREHEDIPAKLDEIAKAVTNTTTTRVRHSLSRTRSRPG